MSGVKPLHDLQELDLEMADVERSLKAVIARLADDSEFTSARERVDQLQARLDELSSQRRSVERGLTEIQEALERLDSRLYGGAVTNPQQLAAAQEERSFTVQNQGESEDRLLELMVAVEEAEPVLAEAQSALSSLEANRPGEEAEWRKDEARFNEQLSGLGRSREEMLTLVPNNSIPLYEWLRKRKGGRAVAEVKRGMCQGCRLTLPTMELQRARAAHGIVQCSSCGRILYAE